MQLPPLIITPSYSGSDGLSCLARQVSSVLVEAAFPRGVEVWSLVDSAKNGRADGIALSGASGSRLAIIAWSLRRGFSTQQNRLVVTTHTHLAPTAMPLIIRGAKLIHILVGIEAWKPLSVLEARALKSADRLLSISRHTEEGFKRANPAFRTSPVIVCHPGLPMRAVDASESGEGSYALIVGRMSRAERYKGHDVLLEIWPEVQRGVPGARLLVVGDGDDRDRLEQKACAMGLADSVRFVGPQPEEAMDEIYRRCAFFVMPSRREGFGFVFIEAMRAGKPCIGGTGAASEIIEKGVSGFVVNPDERGALVSAITALSREPELRREMGQRARERYSSHFTAELFRARFLAALEIQPLACADRG